MSVRRPSVKRLLRLVRQLFSDARAATAVEYGLIVAVIVIAAVAAIMQVADTTTGMWNNVSTKVIAAH